MTYVEALAQYHLRPEAKFLNGDFCNRGSTSDGMWWQHKSSISARKRTNGKSAISLARLTTRKLNMASTEKRGFIDAAILELCEKIGERTAAHTLGVSRTALRRALKSGVEGFVAGDARATATPDAFPCVKARDFPALWTQTLRSQGICRLRSDASHAKIAGSGGIDNPSVPYLWTPTAFGFGRNNMGMLKQPPRLPTGP